MKYHILNIIMFFTGIMVQAQMTHTVNFSTNDYTIQMVTTENGETYNQIKFAGLQFTEESGYPNLPVKYVKLIIPTDKKVGNVTIDCTLIAHHYVIIINITNKINLVM